MSDIVVHCKVARQALSDWSVTYAPDMCSEETVAKAMDRVLEHGTLAYIANAIDRLSAAISSIEQLERELASARSEAEQINREAFMVFIRKWAKIRFGKWITYNTAKGAYSQFCEERAAIHRLAEQEGT